MRSTSCCRGGTVTGAASTLPGFRLRASFSVRGEFAGTSTQSILCSRILRQLAQAGAQVRQQAAGAVLQLLVDEDFVQRRIARQHFRVVARHQRAKPRAGQLLAQRGNQRRRADEVADIVAAQDQDARGRAGLARIIEHGAPSPAAARRGSGSRGRARRAPARARRWRAPRRNARGNGGSSRTQSSMSSYSARSSSAKSSAACRRRSESRKPPQAGTP